MRPSARRAYAASVDTASRPVLVTGATGGIGYFVAEQLAGQGRPVVLAARNPAKAEAAVRVLDQHVPGARVEVLDLDLADLSSVAAAAARLAAGPPLAALVANAALVSYGVRRPAPTRLSTDGVELHFATAHLGHYALLAALAPQLCAWGTRLVHVGSLSHRIAPRQDPWGGVVGPRPERSLLSYARSKLAVTLLAAHLARVLPESHGPASVLAHPGTAVDALTPERDGIPASQPTRLRRVDRALVSRMHGKHDAATVLVHAATAGGVAHGEHWGPAGTGHLSGPPVRLAPPRAWGASAACASLLALSERLTGLRLELEQDGTGPGSRPSQP